MRRSSLLLGVLTLLALGTGATPAAAAPDPPSLRLFAATQHVILYRHGRTVPLDLGVWVTPVGGDFELRVSRPDYDTPPAIAQVDGDTGRVVRALPADVLAGWRGLRQFFAVTFRGPGGRAATTKHFAFCPNTFERQRVDDRGETESRYPMFCSSQSPFRKGMVWGLDDHWAAGALAAGDFFGEGTGTVVHVPPGRYSVTVRVARRYAELFSVPAEGAAVTLDVTVKAARRGPKKGPGFAAEAAIGRRPARTVPNVTDPDPSVLPDLVAPPAWGIRVFHRGGRDLLSFAATPWNAGRAPLVVEGFRRPGTNLMDAYQYFYDEDGNVVGRAPVGGFRYDARRGHQHWHFLQFSGYSLLDASRQTILRSRKQAFCIAPTDAIDLTMPGANWTAFFSFGSMCGSSGSIWIRERMDVGWGDTYFQTVPGQAFDVTSLPAGWYYLRIQANPLGNLYDASEANDAEDRLLYLDGRPGRRHVVVTPWHGIKR